MALSCSVAGRENGGGGGGSTVGGSSGSSGGGQTAAAGLLMDGQSPCEDDYESLPTSASLYTHMTAGAVAGILEHTVMYPVDSVKVTLQPFSGFIHQTGLVGCDAGLSRSEREGDLPRNPKEPFIREDT
ncbi:hypothetical protein Chor_002286 [Crotalus horridus]